MISDLHHVGHFAEDYDRTVEYYRDALGGAVGETSSIDGAVDVAFVEWTGFRVEVVARTERGTYLDGLLDALLEESRYHLAGTVPDIDAAMASLSDDGYPMFDERPVDGLGPYVRAFVRPDAVPGLPIELVELDVA